MSTQSPEPLPKEAEKLDQLIADSTESEIASGARPSLWKVFWRGAFLGVLANNVMVLPTAMIINSLAWPLAGLVFGIMMWATNWLPGSLIFSSITGGLLMLIANRRGLSNRAQRWIALIGGILGGIIQFIVVINVSLIGSGFILGLPIYIGQ
jgi:hypothetical protein